MHYYAAFLRGIMPSNPNMSGAKLRGVFEGLGFAAVDSVLASGNLVFASEESDAASLECRIQSALSAELGIPGHAIVRSREVLQRLWDSDPFDGRRHDRGNYLTATFLKTGEPKLPVPATGSALFRVVGYDAPARVVLAITDNSVAGTTPDFMSWVERTLGTDITTRTWATVGRVLRKFPAQ